MTSNGVHGLHWIRYGIAGDQKYLLNEFSSGYDQLVIGANMVAHMPAAISTFVSQKAKKPFIIDPLTHAFQHGVENLLSTSKKSAGELKRSWRALVNRYGQPLEVLSGNDPRPLSPSDLKSSDTLLDFCKRVVLFQRDAITGEIQQGKDSKYLKFLARKSGSPEVMNFPPAMVVAPYFYIGGPTAEEWAKVNLRCIRATRAICRDQNIQIPLAAEIVLSKDAFSDEDFLNDKLDAYRDSGAAAFLLWIDNFPEQGATQKQLERLIEVIERLSKDDTPVINLYGGFFSVAQARVGALVGKLTGVCHGLEHSESKPVIPVSGGIPVAKYYSNNLHSRLPPRVAYQEITAYGALDSVPKFKSAICQCDECRRHIQTSPRRDFVRAYADTTSKLVRRNGQVVTMQFPTGEASDHCTRHYMWCKVDEYRRENMTKAGLKQALLAARAVTEPHLGSEYAGHAQTWARLF